MRISEVSNIHWEFINHEEREDIIASDEEIINIEELETVNQGGGKESYYRGYIQSVCAWISFSIYH